MNTKLSISIVLTLFFGAFSQAATATRTVSPSASEILMSMANDSKDLRAQFKQIMDGTDSSGITADDVRKGSFKMTVTKNMSTITNRKTVITLYPSTATPVDGFSLDPDHGNTLAKLLQGDGGASGSGYSGLQSVHYPDLNSIIGWHESDWRNSDTAQRPSNTVDKAKAYCKGELADRTQKWWFEIFPLHLYCRRISLLNLDAYRATINADGHDDSEAAIPNYQTFSQALDGIAIELAIGATLYQAQQFVSDRSGENPGSAASPTTASEYLKNKARCFPVDSKPFIKTVLQSYLIPFNQTVTSVGGNSQTTVKIKSPGKTAHPEPGYAIGSYVRYNVNDVVHNLNTIANNYLNSDPKNPPAPTGSATSSADLSDILAEYGGGGQANTSVPMDSIADSGILMNNKTYTSFTFNGEGVLHFNFNIRDVHGSNSSPSCTYFCGQPPVRSAPQSFLERINTDVTHDAWFRPGS